jgi:SPP1 family predicted phage head-tail adaptor
MSAPVPIGRLRARLLIEAARDTTDSAGSLIRHYVPLCTVHAQIMPLSGGDLFVAGRMEQSITHRIIMRWRRDLHVGDRFRLQERIFLIHAYLDPDERRRFLDCRCEEIRIG